VFIFLKNKPQQIKMLLQKANQFYSAKKFAKAIKLYQKILKLDSKNFAAKANLATSYFELQKYDLSIPFFQEIISLDSNNPWWYNYLSQAAQKNNDYNLSLDAAWKAVICGQEENEHHLNLAYTIYEIADNLGRETTDSLLKKWYQKFPTNAIAKQCYNSFFYDKNFTRSEPKYVEELFDVFASDFDNILAELQYDSPQLIAQNLYEFYSRKNHQNLQILDVGCGSGLCGQAIKKYIKNCQITGVDISQKMLDKASEKKVYYRLLKEDITDCFSSVKCVFDVIVSSDVFTYFGSLDSLFKNIADSILSNGIFSFTYSLNNENENDFFLMPSSRFVHSPKYVEKLLQKNKFAILKNEEKILRKEGEKDIKGRVVLAIKA